MKNEKIWLSDIYAQIKAQRPEDAFVHNVAVPPQICDIKDPKRWKKQRAASWEKKLQARGQSHE